MCADGTVNGWTPPSPLETSDLTGPRNLVPDFYFIENGADHGAPKYMEWGGAFGLMVTLIWLYIEILHLLSKLRR